MRASPVIPADAVAVRMEAPVLVAQAPPEIKAGAPYRMPKVFRLPTGELCVTFSITPMDHYRDQGVDSPLFVSADEGITWQQTAWPHPGLKGMNPVIMPIYNGEYLCVPAGKGIKLDLRRFPRPVGLLDVYVGFSLYRLDDCPSDVIRWFRDIKAVRWMPQTQSWREEQIAWDHCGQLVWNCNDRPNEIKEDWSQKVYFEGPAVRRGSELLYADYWTIWETDGLPPRAWECVLVASDDNGRSWQRRGSLATLPAGDNACEPVIEMNQAGELVGVMRREVDYLNKPDVRRNPSMYLVHSCDGGYTWSERKTLFDFGVFPRLLQLENGVLVLSFGRPGVWLSFSLDGGHTWTQPQAVLTDSGTCGYTSLLALDRDSFLLAYTDYDVPNANGEPCKSILVQRISVAAPGR